MNDLSWGTKGLDAGTSDKDDPILNMWKIIRTIHVGKLIFWNVMVAGLLIHFGSNYLVRFYLTFALMAIIASTMFFKVICGILYYFYYLIAITTNRSKKKVDAKNLSSSKFNLANSIAFKEPALYSILKSKPLGNKSIMDELKE